MNKNQLNVIMLAGIIIIALYGTFTMFNKIDSRVMERGAEYDKCIWIQEGQTVTQYLEANGHYPTCK